MSDNDFIWRLMSGRELLPWVTEKEIRRTLNKISHLDRRIWQQTIKAATLQKAIEDIAAGVVDGTLPVATALARLEKERIRVETMFLALSFPLEERMN